MKDVIRKISPYLLKGLSVMGGTLSISFANLFIAIILTKRYGIDYYGQFAIYQAAFLTYSILFKPLTWQSIIKYAPTKGVAPLAKESLVLELYSCVAGFSALIIGFLVGVVGFDYRLLILSCIFIIINNGTLIGITRFRGDYYFVSFLVFLTSILKIVIVHFSTGSPLEVFFYITSVEAFLWFIFICYELKQTLKIDISLSVPDTKVFRNHALWGMAHEVLDLPVRHLDKLIIGTFLGAAATGVLDLSKRMSQVVSQVAVPLNAIIFPKYATWVSSGNWIKVKNASITATNISFAASIIILVLFYLFFDTIDLYLFNSTLLQYKDLAIVFLTIQLLAITVIWIHPLSVAVLEMNLLAKIILLANTLCLITLFCAVSYLDLYAAALSFFIQVATVILLKLYFLNIFFRDKL